MLGLEFEPDLIERIRGAGLNPRPAPDLAVAMKTGQGLPAVFVVYMGPTIKPGIGDLQGPVESLWYMVIGIKAVGDQLTGAKARAEAVPLVRQLISALRGWTPPAGTFPIKLTNAPRPQFAAGMFWMPIGFVTTSILN